MARKGSGAPIPDVGATVHHPLWPELGSGVVQTVSKHEPNHVSYATGRIRWSCGQVSVHNLSVLRKVE